MLPPSLGHHFQSTCLTGGSGLVMVEIGVSLAPEGWPSAHDSPSRPASA